MRNTAYSVVLSIALVSIPQKVLAQSQVNTVASNVESVISNWLTQKVSLYDIERLIQTFLKTNDEKSLNALEKFLVQEGKIDDIESFCVQVNGNSVVWIILQGSLIIIKQGNDFVIRSL